MILFLKKKAHQEDIKNLSERLGSMGFDVVSTIKNAQNIVAIIDGVDSTAGVEQFLSWPLVEKVVPFEHPFKLAGREIHQDCSAIDVNGAQIGQGAFMVMAGPCAVESKDQIFAIAKAVSQAGAMVLRGGAFKPRTIPYDFQGLGEQGLQWLRDAARYAGLRCVSEVMSTDDLDIVQAHVDILQIGARNMQNYSLLRAVGKIRKPVLLKRGLSATYKEFLSAAEYVMRAGNPNVILCERGIRTFEPHTRNTLDIAAVPLLRELSHLPIIVDPSHGVGLRHAVPPMARAAMAVKADGLLVEVHTDPEQSVSDAAQTIGTETFSEMMGMLRQMAPVCSLNMLSPESLRSCL